MKNLEEVEEFLYWLVMTGAVVFVIKVLLDMAQ